MVRLPKTHDAGRNDESRTSRLCEFARGINQSPRRAFIISSWLTIFQDTLQDVLSPRFVLFCVFLRRARRLSVDEAGDGREWRGQANLRAVPSNLKPKSELIVLDVAGDG